MTHTPYLVLAILGLVATASAVRADPPAFDAAAAERAFAAGDVVGDQAAAAQAATDPAARAFLWLRESYWRPGPGGAPYVDGNERDTLRAEAHAKWLVRGADERALADPSAGQADPLPLLTALVLDRIRREREGLHSTRAEGPLAAFASHDYVAYFLDQWVPGAYGGPAAIVARREHPPERNLRDDAARNAWLALGAVLGLALLAVMGGMFIPVATSPPPSPGLDCGPFP